MKPGQFLLASALLASIASTVFAQSKSMSFGGVNRTYVLHVPTGLPANPPLMFVLCGRGMTGAQQQSSTQMDKIADREKFIVAYPDPIDMIWDQAGTSDFRYIVALLDTLVAKYQIDRNRIYAAGFSQGAGMTHALGCNYADKFAAIAPVSGNIPATCTPSRAIPMFLTFGTKDIATPAKFMSSTESWAKLNACPTTPTLSRPYPASNPNSLVTRIAYGPCKNGTEVIADSIQGGPHEWPMDTRTKVNNSEEVWTFFKKFSLGAAVSVAQKPERSLASPKVYVSYFGGLFELHPSSSPATATLIDAQGRAVAPMTKGQRRSVLPK